MIVLLLSKEQSASFRQVFDQALPIPGYLFFLHDFFLINISIAYFETETKKFSPKHVILVHLIP